MMYILIIGNFDIYSSTRNYELEQEGPQRIQLQNLQRSLKAILSCQKFCFMPAQQRSTRYQLRTLGGGHRPPSIILKDL
jgi:hypothetical protein